MGILRVLFLSAFSVGCVLAGPGLQLEPLTGFPFNDNLLPLSEEIYSENVGELTSARLPTTVIPEHYDLLLVPVLDADRGTYLKDTATGTVTITVKADADNVKKITLNAYQDLVIDVETGVTVEGVTGGTKFKVTVTRDDPKELLILTLDNSLTKGNQYKIKILFVAKIYDGAVTQHGIFTGKFKAADGTTELVMASTQFEPTGARRTFPCFDEPSLKATFKISLAYAPTYTAVGNNAIDGEPVPFPEIPTWFVNHFKKTVKMSTYLVAIAVAPSYAFVEATPEKDGFKKPVRIYGPAHLVLPPTEEAPLNRDGGAYPADRATRLMTVFEKYTGIEYSLDKIDSIVFPSHPSAMENWGLNTYATKYLLHHPGVTTESERLLITEILAHELVHQWFGNLITCAFWDQIWLNEGFANFFEFYGVDRVNPEFDALEYRQFASLQTALKKDTSTTAQPLINNVGRPGAGSKLEDYMKVFTHFNTYQKGGSLLNMLEALLTPATFENGLKEFLKQNKFTGVKQDSLFTILTQIAIRDGRLSPNGPSVKDIMDTWTLQSGFPLVRVSKVTKGLVYISQERFIEDVNYNHEHKLDPNFLWSIPMAIATQDKPNFDDPTPELWLESHALLKSYKHDTEKWIVVNANAVGFYRVLYDEALFKTLSAALIAPNSVISVKSRAQIIDDYFAFADHGYDKLEVPNALLLTKSLIWDTNPLVWKTVLKHLRGYYNKISDIPEVVAELKAYLLPKVVNALKTSVGDKGMVAILKSELFDWASSFGDPEVVSLSKFLFNLWATNPKAFPLPVDIEPVIMCSAIANAGATVTRPYEQAIEKYADTTGTVSLKQKAYLVKAIGCSQTAAQLDALREGILGIVAPIIDKADGVLALKAIASNPVSRLGSITFVQTDAKAIVDKLGLTAIVEYVRSLSEVVVLDADRRLIVTMIDAHPDLLKPIKPTLDAYVAAIQQNIEWIAAYCPAQASDCVLKEWLVANK